MSGVCEKLPGGLTASSLHARWGWVAWGSMHVSSVGVYLSFHALYLPCASERLGPIAVAGGALVGVDGSHLDVRCYLSEWRLLGRLQGSFRAARFAGGQVGRQGKPHPAALGLAGLLPLFLAGAL